MQRLEVSRVVRPMLGVKRLKVLCLENKEYFHICRDFHWCDFLKFHISHFSRMRHK
jgi:hypothetical protein